MPSCLLRVSQVAAFVAIAQGLCIPEPARSQSNESSASSWWRIAPQPSIVVGTEVSGLPLFKVNSAVRLSDGRIVVADGGLSSRVSVFSANGIYEGAVGRSGEGPGEFKWVTSLQVGPGDSLFVYDASLQRLTVFTPEGEVARTSTFRIPLGLTGSDGLASVSRLAGDTWVGRGAESVRSGAVGELTRDTVVIGLMDGVLQGLRPLAYIPGRMTTSTMLLGRPVSHVPSFTSEALHTTWGRCVFISNGEDPRIEVFASDGSLIADYDGPGRRRPVTQAHVERKLAYELEVFSDTDPRLLERVLNAEARPTSLPFYHRILADEWGHLWLQEYAPPVGVGSVWYVLSQSGELLDQVVMPHDLRVFAITADGVLARITADHGVELVEVLPLERYPLEPAPPLPQCKRPSSSGGSQ